MKAALGALTILWASYAGLAAHLETRAPSAASRAYIFPTYYEAYCFDIFNQAYDDEASSSLATATNVLNECWSIRPSAELAARRAWLAVSQTKYN